MKNLYFYLSILCFGFTPTFAQTTFNGKVIGPDGLGLPGVSVVEKKHPTNGVSTNINGLWTITVPSGNSILQFTSIGMKTIEVATKDAKTIRMKNDTQILDEVVVEIAYGTVRKESLVGAQSSVSSQQIERRPITNITNALNGAAPGIQVLTSSGQPGSSSSIMIRGFGSMNASSTPLYIVDGSPYEGAISDIAASDIESISVLKDAASSAIYGSSAGNGVVLIRTKSGRQTEKGKPNFNFTMNQGITKRGVKDYEKIGIMDHFTTRWQQWYNQSRYSNGKTHEYASAMAARAVVEDLVFNPYAGIKSYYERYSEGGVTKFRITDTPTGELSNRWLAVVMPDGTLNPEVTGLRYRDDLDWEDALLRTGYRSEYSLNGSYKTDKFKSFMSFGYLNEEGYRIETGMERFTGRLNLGYNASEYISIGSNISYSTANVSSPRGGSGIGFISEMAPIYPIHQHKSDGSFLLDEKGNKIYEREGYRPYNGRYNPVERSYLDLKTAKRDALTTRSYFKFNILPNLQFTTNISYDLFSKMSTERYNSIQGKYAGQGYLVMENYRQITLTWNQLLQYRKSFGPHHITTLIGHEIYKYHTNERLLSKKGIQLIGVDEMDNLIEIDDIGSGTNNYRKEGYFGRINYDFDYKYNFSASFRRDGTSRLHPDHRWGNFWSIGAGWHLKKESFLENVDWLNILKLRLSIGQTGNDGFLTSSGNPDYYAYQTLYSIGRNNNDRLGLRLQTYSFEALKWETQTSSDIAIEFGLLNRIKGTIELFNKESKDLIFSFPLPASTGIGAVNKNLGKMRNYGIEASFTLDLIRNHNTKWSFSINGTSLKNKIIRLPEENRAEGIEDGKHKYLEGKSKYEFYLKEWIGVDPEDGLAIYRLDKETYPKQKGLAATGEKSTWTKEGKFAKKHFCGNSIPKIYGGFGTNLTWKNIDFSAHFAYQLGGKTYDSGYQSLMGRSLAGGMAMHKDMFKAWKKPGDITNIPRLDAGSAGNYDTTTSDRFLISSNALMFKSVSLGYTLPKRWSSKAKLNNVRVSISAENLFLLSKRRGLDPMGNYNGIHDGAGYNFQKTIVGSFSFSF